MIWPVPARWKPVQFTSPDRVTLYQAKVAECRPCIPCPPQPRSLRPSDTHCIQFGRSNQVAMVSLFNFRNTYLQWMPHLTCCDLLKNRNIYSCCMQLYRGSINHIVNMITLLGDNDQIDFSSVTTLHAISFLMGDNDNIITESGTVRRSRHHIHAGSLIQTLLDNHR